MVSSVALSCDRDGRSSRFSTGAQRSAVVVPRPSPAASTSRRGLLRLRATVKRPRPALLQQRDGLEKRPCTRLARRPLPARRFTRPAPVTTRDVLLGPCDCVGCGQPAASVIGRRLCSLLGPVQRSPEGSTAGDAQEGAAWVCVKGAEGRERLGGVRMRMAHLYLRRPRRNLASAAERPSLPALQLSLSSRRRGRTRARAAVDPLSGGCPLKHARAAFGRRSAAVARASARRRTTTLAQLLSSKLPLDLHMRPQTDGL